jgi:transcriptional regulator with XRE-family HTH domain
MTDKAELFLDEVGERVRMLRKNKGWTLDQLSDASGLHPSSISQVERGERNLTLQNLSKLAEGLEVAPYQFLLTPDQKVDRTENGEYLDEMLDEMPDDRQQTIYQIAHVLLDWESDSTNGTSKPDEVSSSLQ